MTERGFFDTLEAQLGAGFERVAQQRRARRRLAQRVGGAALAVLLAVGAGAIVLRDEPAAAGVRVEERDGLVYVRLVDLEYRADVIEDAARQAGIDVSVESVPTGPSLIGRFIRFAQTGEDTGELRRLDADGPAFDGFAIPADFDGTLVLQVGRPASDDEPYGVFPNALAAGEPLACSGVLGMSPIAARRLALGEDLDVRWTVVTEQGVRPVPDGEVAHLVDLRVGRAQMIEPETVSFALADRPIPAPDEDTADAIC